jgi:hypothetical protein
MLRCDLHCLFPGLLKCLFPPPSMVAIHGLSEGASVLLFHGRGAPARSVSYSRFPSSDPLVFPGRASESDDEVRSDVLQFSQSEINLLRNREKTRSMTSTPSSADLNTEVLWQRSKNREARFYLPNCLIEFSFVCLILLFVFHQKKKKHKLPF